MTINLQLTGEKSVSSIVKQLKALNLFLPASDFDQQIQSPILDPDGRRIELCGPNPFQELMAIARELKDNRKKLGED